MAYFTFHVQLVTFHEELQGAVPGLQKIERIKLNKIEWEYSNILIVSRVSTKYVAWSLFIHQDQQNNAMQDLRVRAIFLAPKAFSFVLIQGLVAHKGAVFNESGHAVYVSLQQGCQRASEQSS